MDEDEETVGCNPLKHKNAIASLQQTICVSSVFI
jgi:hypothetical protein